MARNVCSANRLQPVLTATFLEALGSQRDDRGMRFRPIKHVSTYHVSHFQDGLVGMIPNRDLGNKAALLMGATMLFVNSL